MNILISACLLGVKCRYDGGGYDAARYAEIRKHYTLIPVCPEIYGGLTTPRAPSELIGDRVVTKNGEDVTDNYRRGAEQALYLARLYDCKIAILKKRSPSCGSGRIYDGTFSGTLTDGDGMTAELLRKNGITVIGEDELDKIL